MFPELSAFLSKYTFQGRKGLLGLLQFILVGSQIGVQFSHTGLTEGSCDQQQWDFFIVHINCIA